MSQKVDISQVGLVIDNIGATTKTVEQLNTDYANARTGQEVHSDTELYKKTSTTWTITSKGNAGQPLAHYSEGELESLSLVGHNSASSLIGYYVRINKVVNLVIYISFSSTTGNNSPVRLTGLPFIVTNEQGTGQNAGGLHLTGTNSGRHDLFDAYPTGNVANDYIQAKDLNQLDVPYSAYHGRYVRLTGFYLTT